MHLTAVLLIALVFLRHFGEQPADIKNTIELNRSHGRPRLCIETKVGLHNIAEMFILAIWLNIINYAKCYHAIMSLQGHVEMID